MLPERIPRPTPPGPGNLSPAERKARRTLAAQVCAVSRQSVGDWHGVAQAALRKPWQERSQFERACIEFHKAVERAVGEAGLRVHRVFAEASGVIRPPSPPTIITTTTKTDGDGNIIERTVVERELPLDWRAAVQIARYRFPDELGAGPMLPPDDSETTPDLSPGAIVALISAVKRARQEGGYTPNGQVIDVDGG
jgi:hypothetical protein